MYRVVLAAAFSLALVGVSVPAAYAQKPPPPCDPKTQKCDGGADCSPGFYKNHPDTWDNGICCAGNTGDAVSGEQCDILLEMLKAHGFAGAAQQRAAAKGVLDACFGTAAASPCTDD